MLQQGSTHRRRWLCRATRSARLLRYASAAFASAASIVATNASATLPTLGLMIRWPEFCCQKSPTITCKSNKLVTVQTFDFHLKHLKHAGTCRPSLRLDPHLRRKIATMTSARRRRTTRMKTLTLSQRRRLRRYLSCSKLPDTTVKEKENSSKLTCREVNMTNVWNKG